MLGPSIEEGLSERHIECPKHRDQRKEEESVWPLHAAMLKILDLP